MRSNSIIYIVYWWVRVKYLFVDKENQVTWKMGWQTCRVPSRLVDREWGRSPWLGGCLSGCAENAEPENAGPNN